MLDWAAATAREQPLVVRLVKGAYWDHEVVDARQHGWTPPVFEDEARLGPQLRGAHPAAARGVAARAARDRLAQPALGGARGGRRRASSGREDRDVEFQVLRGLGDDLAAALADLGQRVRIYCPVGDLVAGMAYLVRRLLENTANESFLGEQQRGTPIEELLAAP